MLDQVLGIKQRREDAAARAELQSRLELEQAASAVRAERQRKADYETWSVEERQRLYRELQEHGAVTYNELMQWNAQVADIKQGLLDIEAGIIQLEEERRQKMSAHEAALSAKQDARQQVVKFTELVDAERLEAMLEQQAREEKELEDFRRPEP
ncbi:MAG: YscO family type III secretion system apparatus protein [Gammaproteobacteria bacterium]|nr:YscO family type III secretion system apparatus protein [Gammaproteobacteria bacterium]MDE0511560.1 YscO family type III secretion system apparatus protein [Gammaproteobacteria bacterium]